MSGTAVSLDAMAAVLDTGARLDDLSRVLTAAALIGLMAGWVWGTPVAPGVWVTPVAPGVSGTPVALVELVLIAAAGLAQFWFAARVRLDAALFREASRAGWAGVDAALMAMTLMQAAKSGRGDAARIAGAMGLLRWQAVAAAAQIGLIVISALVWVSSGSLGS